MSHPKMKTFINPSQVAIAEEFNKWSEAEYKDLPEGHTLVILNTEILFSPALQKFVVAVIYASESPD